MITAFLPDNRALRLALIVVFVVAVAAVGRAVLLASGAVSFHSDEAVVALMARHILDGARPVFFYGQAYMGSLDAWLTAIGFAVMGESVNTVRAVQMILYLGIVGAGAVTVYKLTRRMGAALAGGLLLAVPSTLTALYTSATLGGYNETLLIGCLVMILGADAMTAARDGQPPSIARYAAIGLLTGLGWWSNGLIVMLIAPVGLIVLLRIAGDRAHLRRYAAPVAVVIAAFFVGSAPWWAFNLDNAWAALRFYLPGGTPDEFAGGDVAQLPVGERLIGLFLLGLPAVIGLRYPWSAGYLTEPVWLAGLALFALAVTLLAIMRLAWRGRGLTADGRALLLVTLLLFAGVFTVSRFSTDPTGRYFLPLVIVLAAAIGAFAASAGRIVGTIALGGILIFHAVGLIGAVNANPPGVTTQFNLDTHIPNESDDALIAFLEQQGLTRGYSQYWITFRLAFLSEERLIFRAALPYKRDLGYTPRDDRYPPYVEAVEAARTAGADMAYVIGPLEPVRVWLEGYFAAQGVVYQMAQVGTYSVYYAFSPTIPPPP